MVKKSKSDIEETCLERAKVMARLCDAKRAEDVRVLDLRDICGFADFFVIASASNTPQMKGIVKDIEKEMAQVKYKKINEAGVREGGWVLIDYGDILVHLFESEMREYYDLDGMWGDAVEVAFE